MAREATAAGALAMYDLSMSMWLCELSVSSCAAHGSGTGGEKRGGEKDRCKEQQREGNSFHGRFSCTRTWRGGSRSAGAGSPNRFSMNGTIHALSGRGTGTTVPPGFAAAVLTPMA